MTLSKIVENNYQKDHIIEWGYNFLSSHGYVVNTNLSTQIRITPWSFIFRFFTDRGYIYLKHISEKLALEPNIIELLHTQFQAPVPTTLGKNIELNSFLMKDDGITLRQFLNTNFEPKFLATAIDKFTALQVKLADHIDIFLKMGVPDWRLDNIPNLYLDLISKKNLLIEDGLIKEDLDELEKLYPLITNLCHRLSEFPVKPSFVQPDFHDNNILIEANSKKITLIDLGEITISHPFFSLITFLDQTKQHHFLSDTDDLYLKLMDSCLESFIIYDSKGNLTKAFEIARVLYFVYKALCDYRLLQACASNSFSDKFRNQGRPSMSLKKFISLCNTLNSL